MPGTCEIHIKLSRADFSTLGLGDKKFSIEAEHGNVLEVYHPECKNPGEELRDLLDESGIVFLGTHGSGADHGWGVFAADGERSPDGETDCDETYLVPADCEGVVDQSAVNCLQEFVELRKLVTAKLGHCSCCEVSPDKCRSSGR